VGRELAIDPATEPAPEIAPVLAELELVQVAAEREPVLVVELERDQVATELERVPVAAVLAQDHPRVQPAVALRTKSATAAHRRGLPLLTAEDLGVVVAETLLGPAATEAVGVWEAADLATVAAVVGVEEDFTAAANVAAVGDEKRSMRKHK
jgi:hypothetical protein